MSELAIVPVESIGARILVLRGQRVILDADLARLYGVTTKQFNQAVRRNLARFPGDFMFRVSAEEAESLRSQIVTSKAGRGGRRYLPYAFTEHGAAMAATVLNTPRAVEVSVYVVRAFVRLRELLAGRADLAEQLAELERRLQAQLTLHGEQLHPHSEQITAIMGTIEQLMALPESLERQIGFTPDTSGHEGQ